MSSRRTCGPLLELDEVRRLLGLNQQAHGGTRPVPVASIVGTVGRCCDFDRCFHALKPSLRSSVAAVGRVFADGAVPPIDVYQVGDAYFVSDGHKRVAAARKAGAELVDAVVTELPAPSGLAADATAADVELAGRELWFLRESGLADARRGLRIQAALPRTYADLLRSVRAHGYELARASGSLPAEAEAAAHWLDCAYTPAVAAARARGLTELLPLRDPELFLALEASDQLMQADACDCAELEAGAVAAAVAAAELPTPAPPRRPSLRWRPRR